MELFPKLAALLRLDISPISQLETLHENSENCKGIELYEIVLTTFKW